MYSLLVLNNKLSVTYMFETVSSPFLCSLWIQEVTPQAESLKVKVSSPTYIIYIE